MKAQILELLSEHGVFAEPEVIDYLAARDTPVEYCEKLLRAEEEPPLFLNMDTVKELEAVLERKLKGEPKDEPSSIDEKGQPIGKMSAIHDEQPVPPLVPKEAPRPTPARPPVLPKDPKTELDGPRKSVYGLLAPEFKPMALQFDADIRVLQDITGNSTCEGDIKDFTSYFKSRYQKIRKLLRARPELRSSPSIEYIKDKKQKGELKVIGLVSDVRTAKWGGIILKIEDDTAEMDATVGKDEYVVKDEVVGLIGKLDEKHMSVRVKTLVRP